MARILVWGLTGLLVAVTLLPLSRSTAWWVRIWDFPRMHIAAALAALVPLAFLLPTAGERWLVVLLAAGCFVWHAKRIRPFTPLARREVRLAPAAAGDVTALAANVLMENTDHDRLIRLVSEVDPDILFLMETDARWLEALTPLLARYSLVVREPRSDHYGLIFATRLQGDAHAVYLTPDETPAVLAKLATVDGRVFHFVGLHPQPPIPDVDTDERDAQILFAARFAHKTEVPVVTMGDFNEAAWSDGARRFKHFGGYVDPRVGRGFYASFDANRWLIRTPIDQIYATPDVVFVDFHLGPHIGSDHFPVILRMRVDRDLGARLNRPPQPFAAEEAEEMDARLDAWRTRLGDRAS